MKNVMSPFWVWEEELPPQICNYIIKKSINLEEDKWVRGVAGNDNKDDKENRKTDVQFWGKASASGRWSNGIFLSYILNANHCNFGYDLSLNDHEQMQVCRYVEGQFYNKHTDWSYKKMATRKLSASIQLSDEKDYEGGELVLNLGLGGEYRCPKSQGTVLVFDSRIIHWVEPVTSGVRYSVQKWVHGDRPLR